MTRKKNPGAYTAADSELIGTLFDTGERDHIVSILKDAHDEPSKHRAYLADALETFLLLPINRYIEKLREQGRGLQASEFGAATDLRNTTEDVVKALRLSDPGTLGESEAAEYSEGIDQAWTRFIADASAYRMGELASQLHQIAGSNEARKTEADNKFLRDYTDWQDGVASQLVGLNSAERADKFKRARRPGDRDTRRLHRLLESGKIPPLKK